MLAAEASVAELGQQQPHGSHFNPLCCRHVLQGILAIYIEVCVNIDDINSHIDVMVP